MQSIVSSVALRDHQKGIVDVVQDGECVVFLDTNVLAWGFRLNKDARRELVQWLDRLAQDERLIVPGWSAHEYNHHLLRRDPNFFSPHDAIGRRLKTAINELDGVAHLMVDDPLAAEFGYGGRAEFLAALAEASDFLRTCADQIGKDAGDRRASLVATWERLINKTSPKTDIHALAVASAGEAPGRYANRLSPGYNDAGKAANAPGDLIIWREILECCATRNARKALLITNDRKSDWVYTPFSVVLPNGKAIDGTNVQAKDVKLPKPDLAAEFALRTDGGAIQILTIEAVVDVLSSDELNRLDAKDFRHLALAIKLNLARTPTEAVVQWFLENRGAYEDAIRGVCNWGHSPSEVDQAAFEAWTIAKMTAANAKAKFEEVRWGDVFCELFL